MNKNNNLFKEFVSYFRIRKKYFLLPIVIILFLTSFALVSANIEDNFERSSSSTLGVATNGNTWDETANLYEILDNELYRPSGAEVTDAYLEVKDSNPSRLDFWDIVWEDVSLNNRIILTSSSSSTTSPPISLMTGFSSNNALYCYYSGSYNSISTVSDGVEYNLSLRNINYVSNDYDVYIDDVFKVSCDFYFDGDGEDIFGIDIFVRYLNDGGSIASITSDGTIYSGGDSVNNISISVIDEWNVSLNVNNVSATLQGSTFTNATGNIIYTNVSINGSENVNINLSGNNYFSKKYSSVNLATDLTLSLFASVVDFETKELISNDTLVSLNYTINGQQNTTFHLSEGIYTVLVEKSGYYALNHTFNVSVLDNRTELIEGLYNTILYVNLTDVVTSSLIEENSFLTVTKGVGYNETFSNTNGSLTANLIQGNYNLTYWADNYAYGYTSITINSSTYNATYILYSNNSLWVTAVDFNTGASLNNFSVEVYNATLVYTFNDRATFTAKQNNITSGVYSVRVDKDGYSSADYSLTMTGGSHQSLKAYLVQSGSTTIFTFNNIVTGANIEDLSVSMYKTINSTWTLVNAQYTDLTGRVQFAYVPNIEYKFVATGTGYVDKTFFLKPLFIAYTITMNPNTQEEADFNTGDFYVSINPFTYYDESTNNLTFSISSGSGTIEYYNITITAPNVSLNGNYSNALGDSHDFTLHISGAVIGDVVTVSYGVKESGRAYKTFKRTFSIINSNDNSNFFKWDEQSEGMGMLEKTTISTILLLMIVGLVATGSAMAGVNPLLPSAFAFIVFLALFAIVGFVPIWSLYICGFSLLIVVLFSARGY